MLSLSACQADVKNETTVKPDPVVTHGEPSSKGPQALPSDQNGPDAPPPERANDPKAQAITTKENIRLTLPLKSN